MVNVLEDLKQFAGFISLIPYYVTENVQLLDRCMLIWDVKLYQSCSCSLVSNQVYFVYKIDNLICLAQCFALENQEPKNVKHTFSNVVW